MTRRLGLVAIGIAIIVALPIAWYVVSPLFIRTTLVEPSAVVAEARPVGTGTFGEIDAIHKGSGNARVSRLPDGRLRVEFSNFTVTNGPDLHVFLSRHPKPDGDAQVKDGLNLGKLKASEGAFSYETEEPADPGEFQSVAIHCVQFRTLFSYATLT